MKVCEQCGREYDMPSNLKYCPECSGERKKTRWRKPEQKTCAVCGKSFVTVTGAACCAPACSRVYARRIVIKKCERCGKESLMQKGARLCGDCQGAAAGEEKKKLTTDIALYFMVLHGFALKAAAQELHMSEQSLKKHLQKESEAALIEKLTAYYAEERQKRFERGRTAAGRAQA